MQIKQFMLRLVNFVLKPKSGKLDPYMLIYVSGL